MRRLKNRKAIIATALIHLYPQNITVKMSTGILTTLWKTAFARGVWKAERRFYQKQVGIIVIHRGVVTNMTQGLENGSYTLTLNRCHEEKKTD